MIKCDECGFENPDGSDTCLNCGAHLVQKKLSQAMDDINEEATIMLGAPQKNPFAAPSSKQKEDVAQPSEKAPHTPQDRPAENPHTPANHRPSTPQSKDSGGLSATTLFLVVAGGVLVAGLILFFLVWLVA